jgi:hypothetical protein
VLGLNPSGGEIFDTRPDRPWGPPTSCKLGTGSSPGVKRPGHGVDHPPLSGARVKERVELYLWAFMASYRVSFTISLLSYHTCTWFRYISSPSSRGRMYTVYVANGTFYTSKLTVSRPFHPGPQTVNSEV